MLPSMLDRGADGATRRGAFGPAPTCFLPDVLTAESKRGLSSLREDNWVCEKTIDESLCKTVLEIPEPFPKQHTQFKLVKNEDAGIPYKYFIRVAVNGRTIESRFLHGKQEKDTHCDSSQNRHDQEAGT